VFDSICLHNPQPVGSAFDLGILAEAMVFYRQVHVLVGASEILSLLRICGPDSLCAALESGFIELVYVENHLGVATINDGQSNERHGLVFTEAAVQKLDEWVYKKLLLWTDNRRKSRSLTDRLVRHVKPTRWKNPEASAARNDLLDPDFANACARAAVPHLAPGYIPPDDAYFRVKLEAESSIPARGFTMDMSIDTNFDFDTANRFYRRAVPDARFNKAAVLTGVFAGLTDLRVAASFSEEMAVSPSAFAIAELKLSQLLSRRDESVRRIDVFQEWTCDNGRAIREAVTEKKKNFEDILQLVEAAGRFKEWLADVDPSSDLVKEYVQAVCSASWADNLPPKVVRILLFNAAGAALSALTTPVGGVTAGLLLSALDTFLVDRLVKGWKPNQFVERALKQFID
jgi:hypothetical protein